MARQKYKVNSSARTIRRKTRSLTIWGMKHRGANNYSRR